MIDKALNYINKHNLDSTPEELFADFEKAYQIYVEFEEYIKDLNMKRSQKATDRRKLFAEWYMKKHQKSKMIKEMLLEISEMTFTSTRTIERDISTDTTV